MSLGTLYSFNPDLTLRWSQSVSSIYGPALGQDGTVVVAGSGTEFRVYQTGAFFYTVTPCRLVDTRGAPGPYGGPALADAASRTFVLAGRCGIPPTATALALNVAVTQPTTGPGFLTLYPAAGSRPVVSSLNYTTGQTRANNAVVPLGAGGDLNVYCGQGSGTAHLVIDVTGYYQ